MSWIKQWLKAEVSQAWSFDQDSRIEDGGEEVEEEKAGEEEKVGREEWAPQVAVVGDRFRAQAEGGTEASQECHEQKAIGGIIAMLVCRDKSDDGIGDEKDGEGDEGVVLEEAGDQGVADNSHHGVGKDEDDTFHYGAETALSAVRICYLVLCHPFSQRDDWNQEPKHLDAHIQGVFLGIFDANDKDNVKA